MEPLRSRWRSGCAALALAGCAVLPATARDRAAPLLPPVAVTTRVESAPAFDLPASLDVIDLGEGALRPQASLSEALGGVPGLLARDRQNLAQDTQLSIRGFGARSTFGVRGVRLYADGIPATMPDGQGQLSHFALAAGERIEVMRGPFSALYGNSSGGVVQLWTADGHGPASLRLRATAARYGASTASMDLRGGGEDGDSGYHLSAWQLDTDGYREHGAARRRMFNAKLHHELRGGGRLELVGNLLDAPNAQDPLGLDREQWRADPRQATPQALQYDTRKSVRQGQLGAHWTQPLGGAATLRVTGHGGQRAVTQYLAVPVAAQASPLSAGGVVDLDGGYGGLDARVAWRRDDGGLELTVGTSAERQRQQRRGYENFDGARLGVRGALRRDQHDIVAGLDQYAQAWWRLAPRWSLQAGARYSTVRFRSDDRYLAGANPDDSGRVEYSRLTPVAGLVFAPGDDLRLYLSAGRGFETPTFNELAYRADGAAGLALDLRPAVSDNLELGAKWRGPQGIALEGALFRADTRDELAVARNSGGRSSYRNAGHARRQGAELVARVPMGSAWTLHLAATWLDARFRDDFAICAGAGCTIPDATVAAGTRIPGVPGRHGLLRLQWQGTDWQAAVEASGSGAVSANDLGSATAPGHGLLHLEAGRDWSLRAGRLRGFARADNLLDRRHVGSVIVNEGNGRYYEPGPGRSLLLGLEWRLR
ncbi:TonB-dependent receptor [Pseudoxanthomonas broegbernensis]|uniref:TonB-dependent receptor n=1 Tax=Pseudoxanthomonas broegbernensis TaxID=83619 RepID=A0A7V8GKL5_9GAMM|nr:TonB-dependent receptor [Pseudoxanthomonas broegbernensis]KAF1685080.1 TonB-dependent receptor [Pseudoxanthomonas broegbernensis]MBB6066258.1 iron complex outermembrane receptor protein [Pseudoxanthomonas broegbernensis]